MAATKTERPGLAAMSDQELIELLTLMKGSDSVELKLTVPSAEHRATIAGLRLDPLDAQIRQVFFFDTPDLTLNQAGVVVRARRSQGKPDDSVVKLRPVVPDELPPEVRKSPSFGVEVDRMPGGHVCSGSMKATLGTTDVREATSGKRPLRKLFTKEQRAFYSAHAPEGLAIDDLAILGPIFCLKLKTVPEGATRKMVAEMWLYPDGSRVLEISTKCTPAEAFQVAAESRAFLTERGVNLFGEQETKTRRALEYFAAELGSAGA
jgi:hypothetical protein